ncbi:MAG: TonB-dependent receptor [Bacteroidales bacterium]|nr:TonB-dependent receptor [Bacteroidales bacterium]
MKKTAFIIILMLCSLCLGAQRKGVLKGQVLGTDATGAKEAVPFAMVRWLESGTYMECDLNGKFEFNTFNKLDATLVAMAMGFTTDTIKVSPNDSYIEFNLRPTSTLDEARVTARDKANFISKTNAVKTEVISAAGLCKMACCNLAESFENSASVSVGYSDAVTGARQIRLLGLSGTYVQMQDENRPVMRGLASPFGLGFVPGQWLESIQVAKGPSSVINGIEAITGQINLEHRKPTDEKPLFIQAYISYPLRAELNIASSLQLNERWSTVLLAHASTDPLAHDGNKDGFRDEPTTMQFNFSNRWLYFVPDGIQVRFGVRGLYERRIGGQMGFTYALRDSMAARFGTPRQIWGTSIENTGANAYLKVGIPLESENKHNIAVVADYNFHKLSSVFGLKHYNGTQNSGFLNVIYQGIPNDSHRWSFGVRDQFDHVLENYQDGLNLLPPANWLRRENSLGVYGEYTFTIPEKLTVVADLSFDWNNVFGSTLSPRLNVRYSPLEWLTIRAQGGRGSRSPYVFVDNLGILSTSRAIMLPENLTMERAWTYGGNITFDIPLGVNDNCYFSFDYFRSDFTSQLIVDQEWDDKTVQIYNMPGPSFTNTFQADFNIEPFERFTILATFRYTDSRVTLRKAGSYSETELVDRPLYSKYKGVLNLQYSTRMNIWTFDFTAQLNGPARLPSYAITEGGPTHSPVYPILYAQVTRKFKGVDVYIGAENLTNFKQPNPIIDAENPYAQDFNASAIWGPLMGIKVYAGARFTLWKY